MPEEEPVVVQVAKSEIADVDTFDAARQEIYSGDPTQREELLGDLAARTALVDGTNLGDRAWDLLDRATDPSQADVDLTDAAPRVFKSRVETHDEVPSVEVVFGQDGSIAHLRDMRPLQVDTAATRRAMDFSRKARSGPKQNGSSGRVSVVDASSRH